MHDPSQVMDLRTFLDDYRKQFPHDILETDRPIDSRFEVTAVAKALEEEGKYPTVLFHNVKDVRGARSPHPLVINVLGDRNKLAHAIGVRSEDIGVQWAIRAAQTRPPQVISREEAPCKAHVYTGDQVDLWSLPIVHHHEMDPGRYITAGMCTTYDVDSWSANSSLQRGWVVGPREIRIFMSGKTHNFLTLKANEEAGRRTPVAFWVGHHPAVMMGASSKLPYQADHYAAAGGLAGQSLRVVPSETLGDDFLVPADAEFVIEGYIEPGHYDLEGPFGEYPRYYGPQRLSPVMTVTAMTHRQNAIWDSFMVGITNWFGSTQEEGSLYTIVKRVVPQVTRVYVPGNKVGKAHAYIQMRKTHDGQPVEAIMAALSSGGRVKHVVVVDEDINLFDEREILWAIATRSQWDRDLLVIPRGYGAPLDPSADDGLSAKGGIDATKPAPPARYPLKLTIPDEVSQRINLKELFGS